MDNISRWAQRNKTPLMLAVGVVPGMLVGFLLAWVIWPVQYLNATPNNLRPDFQKEYLIGVASQYASDGDLERTRDRIGLEFWDKDELVTVLAELSSESSGSPGDHLRALSAALKSEGEPPSSTRETLSGESEPTRFSIREVVLIMAMGIAGLVFLLGQAQWIRRIMFAVILVPTLIFFIAIAIDLGQVGGLTALSEAVPTAAGFTMDYLANMAQGDLGVIAPVYSSAPAVPVVTKLAQALPRSLGLLAAALALAVLIGLPLGIGGALRRNTRFSGMLVFFSVLGISTPSYFAAMLLIWFGVWLYKSTGMTLFPVHGFGWDAHLILPALVLAARPAASVMRLGYNALVEVLDADFVRTAHAKGLGPWVVFFRHVLRNAGIPLLTTVAVSLRFSLAILPIVEYIFTWSGVGEELLTAVQVQDTTAVIGMVLPLAALFVLVNLLLELLYLIVDPRLRTKEVVAV